MVMSMKEDELRRNRGPKFLLFDTCPTVKGRPNIQSETGQEETSTKNLLRIRQVNVKVDTCPFNVYLIHFKSL